MTGAWNGTEGNRQQVMPTAGTFRNLRVKMNGTPGAGKSYTFMVRKNGADTSVTCVIADTATSASDTANSFSVVAGDLVTLKVTPSGTPTGRTPQWTIEFEGTTSGESLILGGGLENATAANTTEYNSASASSVFGATETNYSQVVSTPGTIKSLYINQGTAPGLTKQIAYTMRKNGADTALTCTVSGTATTANDTVNSFTVVAGDVITIKYVSSLAAATSLVMWSTVFVADTNGESLILGSSGDPGSTGSTGHLSCAAATWDSTESITRDLAQGTPTLKNLFIVLDTAPAGTATRTLTFRKNASNSTTTVTITGSATTGNDTTHSQTTSNDDLINLYNARSSPGTPAASYIHWGMTCYIAPASGTAYTQECTAVITLVDTAPKYPQRALADALVLSANGYKFPQRTITDPLVLVDSVIKSIARTLTDATILNDVFAGIKITLKELIETIVLNDSIVRFIGAVRTETITLVDTITRSISRTIAEVVTLVDSLTSSLSGLVLKTLTETLVLTDTITRSITRTLTESVVLNDILAKLRTAFKTLLETITLNDSITRSITKVLTETATLVDTIARSITRTITETITLVATFAGTIPTLVIRSIGRFVIYSYYGLMRTLNDKPKNFTLYQKGRDKTLDI